jgi:WXG100 family type VII secretion target
MAVNIKVSPEQLRSSSRVFKSNASNTTDMLKRLNSEVNKMRSIWEGQANREFINQYEQLQPSMKQFVSVLEGISKQLADVATTMEDVDRKIASQLRR